MEMTWEVLGSSKVLLSHSISFEAWKRLAKPIRLSFQPLIFSWPAVLFSHNKSANSTFSYLFSAKRTGWVACD
jgi:hypothetical protein